MLQMTQKTAGLTGDSIAQFQEFLQLRGMAANTLRAYASDLRLFLEQSGMQSIPQDRYELTAMAWLRYTRTSTNTQPKTLLRRLTSIRKFAKVMFGEDILQDYKSPTVAPGAPHPIPEGLDGVDRMIQCSTLMHHKALLALCGFCGLRVSEALTITPGHFNLENMSLKVVGKKDKTRFVPVGERAWSHLARPVTAAFVAHGSRSQLLVPGHERGARKAVTAAGARASLSRPVASHDLRATFATALWAACKDTIVVQRILGHSSVTTTQIYIGTEWGMMSSAVNLL